MAAAKPKSASRVYRETARYKREARVLGARIRFLRHAAGWTLEQATERMSLDWKHLQKIEAGSLNVTLVSLVRVAEGFGVSLPALFPSRDGRESGRSRKRGSP